MASWGSRPRSWRTRMRTDCSFTRGRSAPKTHLCRWICDMGMCPRHSVICRASCCLICAPGLTVSSPTRRTLVSGQGPPMNIELTAIEARVIGCLIEKQITTPDQYPLSLNALVNACNQKSNRDPVLELEERTVQQTLDDLGR